MAEYDLPPGPAELFETVRPTLAEHRGAERHVRLGGVEPPPAPPPRGLLQGADAVRRPRLPGFR